MQRRFNAIDFGFESWGPVSEIAPLIVARLISASYQRTCSGWLGAAGAAELGGFDCSNWNPFEKSEKTTKSRQFVRF
jgi:hypothetical protein